MKRICILYRPLSRSVIPVMEDTRQTRFHLPSPGWKRCVMSIFALVLPSRKHGPAVTQMWIHCSRACRACDHSLTCLTYLLFLPPPLLPISPALYSLPSSVFLSYLLSLLPVLPLLSTFSPPVFFLLSLLHFLLALLTYTPQLPISPSPLFLSSPPPSLLNTHFPTQGTSWPATECVY